MRLDFAEGLGVLGAMPVTVPLLTCAVETAGAVMEWPLGAGASWQLTVLDTRDADWLWQLLGETAHVQLLAAIDRGTPGEIDVTVNEQLLADIQKIGYGQWLRNWWPASEQLGLPPLDAVLLDAELAVLTAGLEQILTPDTIDGDIGALLAKNTEADLRNLADSGDVGIQAIGRQALAVLADQGCYLPAGPARLVRADYALVAGAGVGSPVTAVTSGRLTVPWQAVPPGIFDAVEQNLMWSVDANPDVRIHLFAQLLPDGDATGIGVQVQVGSAAPVTGTFSATGQCEMDLPITAAQAWQLVPSTVSVVVGPAVEESAADRAAVRDWAIHRLTSHLGPDRYLAEQQAAGQYF